MSTIIIITPPPTRPKSHEKLDPPVTEIEVQNTEGMSEAGILRAAANQIDPPA